MCKNKLEKSDTYEKSRIRFAVPIIRSDGFISRRGHPNRVFWISFCALSRRHFALNSKISVSGQSYLEKLQQNMGII